MSIPSLPASDRLPGVSSSAQVLSLKDATVKQAPGQYLPDSVILGEIVSRLPLQGIANFTVVSSPLREGCQRKFTENQLELLDQQCLPTFNNVITSLKNEVQRVPLGARKEPFIRGVKELEDMYLEAEVRHNWYNTLPIGGSFGDIVKEATNAASVVFEYELQARLPVGVNVGLDKQKATSSSHMKFSNCFSLVDMDSSVDESLAPETPLRDAESSASP